ncbi:response regulator [Anaerovibrio sp.]|uniref:ANTAR domain-containing response regulator n=1 Tax=Anaerovibrio sp. TaxID=1872532 RepID=UPI001B5CECC2|nr:response regulator [Anaerovibrio sp.]MBP3232372.1 response regulator [Anaerovibrio sp.]MBR2142095.1 response regulator [Anaerovibrio sp.]
MNPLKIVIADDETIIRMDMKELLEEAGHQVVGEAANGAKAVELTKRLKPDLCIFDVKMPEMDGIEAANIVSREKIAPVVLLTAFSQPDIVKKASEAGVLAYLVKPVQESNLFPAIEVAMSRYQEMQALEDELLKVKDTLAMRKLLDRAKGILMDAHNISESQAFSRIQKYSMAKRKTIKEVAEAIIRSATK